MVDLRRAVVGEIVTVEHPADFADGTDADRFKEDVLIRADPRYPRKIQSKSLV
jgi:hypothetical protein